MAPLSDLLVSLAGIAGVFVGFGALVVLSEEGESTKAELNMIRGVVTIGLLTLVGALIPVGLGAFGVSDRALWGWSAGAFLGLIWFGLLHPTNRPVLSAMIKADPKAAAFFWLVLEPPIQVPLVLCVLGVLPRYAPACYLTAVVLNLFQAAQALVQAVYARVARVSRGSRS